MRIRFLVLLAAASPLAAQAAPASSAVADARANWTSVRDYLVQSATDMPEAKYSYRPTASVRSFGEIIAHVAGSQSMFCAIALGQQPPTEDAIESKKLGKDALIAALEKSNTDCARAYEQDDAAAAKMVDLFGTQRSRLFTLIENAAHDNEHYGNLVTYLRMNGMVPPSSRPAPSSSR
jgi:uncharacterized damage-inducible protein DinB